MSKQVLDLEQMLHLRELGMQLSNETTLMWIMDARGVGEPLLCFASDAVRYLDFNHECVLAYTLQNVLDALPKYLHPMPSEEITFDLWIGEGKMFYANKNDLDDVLKMSRETEMIDAAYELLVWCIENKFVETNKKE